MHHSEQINELATALAKAQKLIKAAAKDAENPFFRSSYADLPAVTEACRDALADNGISYSQVPGFECSEIWLETILMHTSGQWIYGRYPVRPIKNDPQGTGSALTYARRYSLMAMVGIVAADEDDDGNAASGKGSPAKPAPARPTRQPDAPLGGDDEREADRVSRALARGEDPLMQGREVEPPEDAQVVKAREFGNRCIGYLNTVRDSAKFKAWHKTNADLIAAIRDYDAPLHARVIAKVRETDERFNPLSA